MLRLPERNGQERTSTNHETPLRSLSSRNCHFGATRQSCNFEPSHEFCGKGNTLVKPYRLPSGGRDSSTHPLKISGNRRQISAGDRGLRFIRLLEYTFLLHLPITSSYYIFPSPHTLQDSPRFSKMPFVLQSLLRDVQGSVLRPRAREAVAVGRGPPW
jgi:hypothetical protein